MDGYYTPAPTPAPTSIDDFRDQKVYIDTRTSLIAFMIFVMFAIAVSRFRLWHKNWIVLRLLQLMMEPVNTLILVIIVMTSDVDYVNNFYVIWLVVIIIAYENIFTFLGCTLLEKGTDRSSREYISLMNYIFTAQIIYKNAADEYRTPLFVIWGLVVMKFLNRLVSYKLADRAYGLINTNLVADYMKVEHELTNSCDAIDPTNMIGYKYFVIGEEKIEPTFKAPKYTAQIKLIANIVTIEGVWNCNQRLLHQSIDKDGRIKDVCLSFALFKLLRRRFLGFPADEAKQDKTKRLIFEGLLRQNDKERVFRVINMELCFLRDLFFTRYPITFAVGFPVINVILLGALLGACIWISLIAFQRHKDYTRNDFLTYKNHNVDYAITNALLILLILLEIAEALSYVFSDWTKVIIICRHVRSKMLRGHYYIDRVLAFLCKKKSSRSLHNIIGQYSLLENYNKNTLKRFPLKCFSYSTCGLSPLEVPPKGVIKNKPVALSEEVKEAIFQSLRTINIYPTNGVASLQRNGLYNDLEWSCNNQPQVHSIMVWHIATSLCEIQPVKGTTNIESIRTNHLVASHLSKYCAYLVAFVPDMLCASTVSLYYMFHEIISETRRFYKGAGNLEEKYELSMQVNDGGESIIQKGSRLGKYLMEIPNDDLRWKIMAEFWAELILFLAPSGSIRAHIRELESGGEFITHLWALFYHAGIVDTSTAEYHP